MPPLFMGDLAQHLNIISSGCQTGSGCLICGFPHVNFSQCVSLSLFSIFVRNRFVDLLTHINVADNASQAQLVEFVQSNYRMNYCMYFNLFSCDEKAFHDFQK